MKIIFLDIDGVLNHELFYRGYSIIPRSTLKRPCDQIDKTSIQILNTLIKETGAKVVLSSTWRRGYTKEEMQAALDKMGFEGEIIDYTPILNDRDVLRGNEILRWIKDNEALIGKPYHEYKTYVILDDDSDMLYWQKDNFIKIDGYCGLTPTNVFRATKILNQERDLTI